MVVRFLIKYYNGRTRIGTLYYENNDHEEIKNHFFMDVINKLEGDEEEENLKGIKSINLQEDFTL